jgi:methionyl-tRNA formyltransferase
VRFLFMGTAAFACPTLRKLVASPHQAVAVLTQPDRPRGRGRQLAMSAVKICALEYHLPVLQPATLRDAAVAEELSSYAPELIVVVAYGLILPSTILALPPYGCINLHASLLPKYRGPAPINWALINGETQTGYTIIQMDAHVDTGPILWREPCAIAPDDDASSLGARLAERGAAGMLEVLNALEQGTLTAQPQPQTGVSLAPKLTRELGRVDWRQAADTLHNLIRGLVPWPGATGVFRDVEVKFWRATVWPHPPTQPPGTVTTITAEGLCVACGEQQLLVQEVQPANRRRMSAKDFVQGYHVQQGDRFA